MIFRVQDLFAETSKELVRELQTREVNERIDASVAHYLALVSEAVQLPSCSSLRHSA